MTQLSRFYLVGVLAALFACSAAGPASPESGVPDAATADSAVADTSTRDATTPTDSGARDTGTRDTGIPGCPWGGRPSISESPLEARILGTDLMMPSLASPETAS